MLNPSILDYFSDSWIEYFLKDRKTNNEGVARQDKTTSKLLT